MGIDWKDRGQSPRQEPTPGPWHWEDWGGAAALVGTRSGFVLAGVQHDDVTVADAALMSAAPDLRDALAWALKVIEGDYESVGGAVHLEGYEQRRALLARVGAP